MTSSVYYVGFVGRNGSGKSTACKYFVEKGFVLRSLSDVIRDSLKKRSTIISRDALRAEGNRIRKSKGNTFLAETCYQHSLEFYPNKSVVFDSIRNVHEVIFLKSIGAKIVGIESELMHRYQRIQSRKHDTDKVSLNTFKEHDEAEESNSDAKQSIRQVLAQCSFTLNNDASLDVFHQHLEELYHQLVL